MVQQKHIKVAFCIPDMIIGGVENVFVNTVEELLKNKHLDISIITHARIREPMYANWLKSHPDLPVHVYYPLHNFFEDLKKYCKVFPLKQLRKIIFSLYKKYRRALAKILNKYSDTDVFIDYKNFEFFRELRHINKPKIAWMHGYLTHFESNGSLSRAENYSALVGITDDFVQDFTARHWDLANKIVRIYNPMNAALVTTKAKQARVPRGRYFCHVSRLVDGKDIKTLLDAFDLFASCHSGVKLYIVGDGDKANEFKAYAQTKKSAKRVVFTGTMDNPYGIMRGAIANILSSEHEGLPTVVLESVALGVPCICANCKNGPREILMNGDAGLLFNIGDSKMLAKQMDYVVMQPKQMKKLTSKATDGLRRFYPSTVQKQIYNLIQKECK